jgi:pimeloyl-ACP methyl ester carboxylesterase
VRARSEYFTSPALDGIRLHARHWGEPGRGVLILLHGGGANLHWWDHLAPALAERFHVVALDFRGHGESDHPAELESGGFDRDLESLVRHLRASPVRLVGHSMGAHVALRHAAIHGGVAALAAIEASRGATRRDRRRARLALAARRSYRTREEAEARYRFLPDAPGADEALRRAVAAHSVRELPDGRFGYRFDPRWFSLPSSPPPPLARITCPCLVLRGADSSLLSAEGAAELAEEIPEARVVEIAEAGHNVHLERPEEVLRALWPLLLPHA